MANSCFVKRTLLERDKIVIRMANTYTQLYIQFVFAGSKGVSQLQSLFPVNYTHAGDFFVNNKYTFEIGGKNKSYKQNYKQELAKGER